MTTRPRPLLAVTMGDAAGIGPEIIIKAMGDPGVREFCRPVVIGDRKVLDGCRRSISPGISLEVVDAPAREDPGPAVIEVVEPVPLSWDEPVIGRATAEAGRAAVGYIEKAVSMILQGGADAMVTAPINKAAIRMAGSPHPGHTEMLAQLTGAEDYAMMLVGGELRVSLATIHIPLSRVPEELDEDRIFRVIGLTFGAVKSIGFDDPVIAVCGLNPHAGEEGLFGNEEREIIGPAVLRAREKGMNVAGPLPADTVFYRALKGDFQAVVAMYHDQGLVPLKTLYFDKGVNVTLGLPIIRTSVDHGTAYDIAGRGVASPESLIQAMRLAARMAGGRG